MSILTEALPTTAEIAGVEYPLNTDFRTALRIIEAFEDSALTVPEQQMIMLLSLYKKIPPDTQKACELAVKFLNGGETKGKEASERPPVRLYSFSQDAGYIFSAIQQTHGVDVEAVQHLHWWKFVSLFMDLCEDCFFCRLVHLRSQLKRGKATKEEREWYDSMREIVDLPQDYNPQEREALEEFMGKVNAADKFL